MGLFDSFKIPQISRFILEHFPYSRWLKFTQKEKKHFNLRVSPTKTVKGWEYLQDITKSIRLQLTDKLQKEILHDTLKGKPFNPDVDIKKAWYSTGVLGIAEYINYVNKVLDIASRCSDQIILTAMAEQKQTTLEFELFGTSTEYNQTINSKRKGNTNERAVASYLHKWVGVKFIRTPSSGGRRLTNNDTFVGDVVCEDQNFKFPCVIETKHYASLHLKNSKGGSLRSNSKVFTFWKQAKDDAVRCGKMPILFLRYNNMARAEWMVFMPKSISGWVIIDDLAPIQVSGTSPDGDEIVGISSKDLLKIPATKFIERVKECYVCPTPNG